MSGVYTTDNSWMEEVDFSDEEQRCKALDARDAESFNGMLGIRFAEQSPDRTVAELDIHPPPLPTVRVPSWGSNARARRGGC